jgi:hypothetical protein
LFNERDIHLREELIFVLNEAAELEHSLSCSYLFAAFSLKGLPGEGLTDDALQKVRRWKRDINAVAVEEMMHLAVVSNLLTAVGAAPHFDRPNFPHDCAYYLPDYQIELRPFSMDTIDQFIAIEQPGVGETRPTIDPAKLQKIEGDMSNEIGADPLEFGTQGHVYSAIELGLHNLVNRLGEENLFIGPPPSQAQRQFFASYGWETISDLESALAAIKKVVEQGEGASEPTPDSHFSRFVAIREDYLALLQADPNFQPARPVLTNPFTRTPPEGSGPVQIIEDPLAVRVSDLFNETYAAMLNLLGRFFVESDETDEEAALLSRASIQVMLGALTPLGELLTRLPVGGQYDGYTAGPSFVLRTLHPLPYKTSARKLLRERFDELGAYSDRLGASVESEIGMQLKVVARSLAGVAHSLA